jgi:hypothetical protein
MAKRPDKPSICVALSDGAQNAPPLHDGLALLYSGRSLARLAVSLLLLMTVASQGVSQGFSLSGTVRDPNGRALPNVAVELSTLPGLDQPATFRGKYSLNFHARCLILVDTHRWRPDASRNLPRPLESSQLPPFLLHAGGRGRKCCITALRVSPLSKQEDSPYWMSVMAAAHTNRFLQTRGLLRQIAGRRTRQLSDSRRVRHDANGRHPGGQRQFRSRRASL